MTDATEQILAEAAAAEQESEMAVDSLSAYPVVRGVPDGTTFTRVQLRPDDPCVTGPSNMKFGQGLESMMTVKPTEFIPGVLPLADLRERLQMLREAGVEEYRDGPVVIRLSAEVLRAQRDLLRPMDSTPQW